MAENFNSTSPENKESELLPVLIPAKLAAAFDDFIVMGISALDGTSCREDWTDDERAIVEWLESDRYKAK